MNLIFLAASAIRGGHPTSVRDVVRQAQSEDGGARGWEFRDIAGHVRVLWGDTGRGGPGTIHASRRG
jgi:hypothetical protein